MSCAWGGEEVASVGEGEEGGLAGGAELGDPNLAWGPALPMKLQVWWSGICLLSLCNSFYKLCCSLRPPKLVPSRLARVLARRGLSNILPQLVLLFLTQLWVVYFFECMRVVTSARDWL